MKIITNKQQKVIDDLMIRKIMFAILMGVKEPISIKRLRLLAESIYFSDEVML